MPSVKTHIQLCYPRHLKGDLEVVIAISTQRIYLSKEIYLAYHSSHFCNTTNLSWAQLTQAYLTDVDLTGANLAWTTMPDGITYV
jgi:hypothetical protein